MRTLLIMLLAWLGAMPVASKQLVEHLPAHSYVVPGYYNPDSVRVAMQQRALHRIEGIWAFPSDGASVVIERYADSATLGDEAVRYRMLILRSPCRSLRPGTVMGYLSATSRPGVYAAQIYTSGNGGATLSRPKDFTLTLIDDAHLSFRQHSRKVRVNLWRLIPYMSRIGLRIGDSDAPADLDGCTRIYPRPLNGPAEPRYL